MALAAGLGALGVGALAARAWVQGELAEHQRQIEDLRRDSARTHAEAALALGEGRYELAVLIAEPLISGALAELVGYEQLTRKGNRFRVERLRGSLREGFLELVALTRFDWRWGFYDGPVEVRYLGFARLADDGSCHLHFRVASASTLERWALLRPWLAPYLTLRLQRALRLPDLALPLGSGQRFRVGEGAADMEGGAIKVRLAAREWQLPVHRPRVFVGPQGMGLLVERLGARGSRPAAAAAEPAPPGLAPFVPWRDDLAIAVRLDRLSLFLQKLVEPADDVTVAIERLVLPWRRPGKVFGVAFESTLALRDVRGIIDVRQGRLRLADGQLVLDLALAGRFAGLVDGELYGVGFSLPVKVRPELVETLPLRLVGERGELGLFLEPRPLSLRLDFETQVRGHTLAVAHSLALPSRLAIPPLTLQGFMGPGWRAGGLRLPARVERGEIRSWKTVPATVAWDVELPPREDGMLTVRGDVSMEAPRQPFDGS